MEGVEKNAPEINLISNNDSLASSSRVWFIPEEPTDIGTGFLWRDTWSIGIVVSHEVLNDFIESIRVDGSTEMSIGLALKFMKTEGDPLYLKTSNLYLDGNSTTGFVHSLVLFKADSEESPLEIKKSKHWSITQFDWAPLLWGALIWFVFVYILGRIA